MVSMEKYNWFYALSTFNPFLIIYMANFPFEKCFEGGGESEKVCFVHSFKLWLLWTVPYHIVPIYQLLPITVNCPNSHKTYSHFNATEGCKWEISCMAVSPWCGIEVCNPPLAWACKCIQTVADPWLREREEVNISLPFLIIFSSNIDPTESLQSTYMHEVYVFG